MKQFLLGLAACGLVAVLPAQAASVAAVKVADAASSNIDDQGSAPAAATDPSLNTDDKSSAPAATTVPSLCLDSMETVPDDDDLVPTPASADAGCSVSTDTIST